MFYDNIYTKIKLKRPNYSNEEMQKLKSLKNSKELYGLNPICIDILFNRGLNTVEKIKEHICSNIPDIPSPLLLKDSDKFINIIMESLNNNEHIVVYGDYDIDGCMAISVILLAIRNLGGNIDYYTNNRFIEGYGMTSNGVKDLVNKYPDVKLIITVDNGIVAYNGVDTANELGIKVLITDHHEQGDKLPNALAIVNHKRKDCTYPFKGMCGAGVIWKLMLLLYFELNKDCDFIYDLLDLVALATVGDSVPLLKENRVYVKEGLKRIIQEERLAFKKLREICKVSIINEETLGFLYGPMINAVGRLDGNPNIAIDIFLSNDEKFIEKSIIELVNKNEKRKEITKVQENEAREMLKKMNSIPNVIVLEKDTFHEGIIGLVAGRLKEEFNRPTIILTEHKANDGTIIYKGSARSIEGFNIKEAFDELKEYLIGYGGHYMAGGLSIKKENLSDFTEAINKLSMKYLSEEDLLKKVIIDSPISAKNVTIDLIQDIEILRPFGMNFEKPKFGLNNFKLDINKNEKIYVGADLNTLRLVSEENLTLIMFKYAERYKYIQTPTNIKAVGYPIINVFNGNMSPQFQVEENFIFNPLGKIPKK